MKPLALLCLLLAACGSDRSAERYGFVTLLGHDTISVERVTRHADALVVDGVDRFPLVRLRHTEIALAPDGSIGLLEIYIRTPSASSAKGRERHFTAEITKDSLRVSVRDSSGLTSLSFAGNGALIMPHVPQMYSLIELYIAAALARGTAAGMTAGDSVAVVQFYPDYGMDRFPIHDGYVRPLPGGHAEIWHDMLAGVGQATLDSNRRLLAYSGEQSTYKVEVKRVTELPDVEAIGAQFAATEHRTGAAQLSVRDTVRANIGAAQLMVDYGRPLARGRTLLGNVIRFGSVWRTGANAATQFSTSLPISLAGLALAAGTYTLWTAPRAGGVADLIVNRETGQWGTGYDDARDLGTAPLKTETVTSAVEKFTITIAPIDARRGALIMEWGTFRWTAPIVVK